MFIYLHMSNVLLYYFCSSLVSVDRLAKRHIFLNLFNIDPTLGGYRGATSCYRTFSISNLTLGPRLDFSHTYFLHKESHLGFFFLILFSLLK